MQNNNRTKIIAVLLNLLAFGAGYFYVGKFKKSIILMPLFLIICLSIYYLSTLISISYFALIPYVLIFGILIYSFIDTTKTISANRFLINKYNDSPLKVFLFTIIILSIVFFNWFFGPLKMYSIPAGSMKNTIMIGDQIIVNRLDKSVDRGDIVAFRYPLNENIVYAKRIVAKGGDIIALKNKNLLLHLKEGNEYIKKNYSNIKTVAAGGKLFLVNPYKSNQSGIYNDSKVVKDGFQPYQLFDMQPILVPEGSFFMMGDNRDHSNDSRFWGEVPSELIVGKVGSVIINFSDFSRVGIKID